MEDLLKIIASVIRTKTPVVTEGNLLITIEYQHSEGCWKVGVDDIGAIYLYRGDETNFYNAFAYGTRRITSHDTLPEAVAALSE